MKKTVCFSLLPLAGASLAMFAQADPARLDLMIRNDFFAGLGGDMAAMARALGKTGAILKENPNHAEALVWQGVGEFSQANLAFREGRREDGMRLWEQGLSKMDKAVELAPDRIGVRIPRGAALAAASHFVPDFLRAELLARAKADYSHAYRLQEKHLDRLSEHARGELLLALADISERSGDQENAREWFQKLAGSMAGSVYGQKARKWLEGGQLDPRERGCLGCHSQPTR